jgi:hypothetical protein
MMPSERDTGSIFFFFFFFCIFPSLKIVDKGVLPYEMLWWLELRGEVLERGGEMAAVLGGSADKTGATQAPAERTRN